MKVSSLLVEGFKVLQKTRVQVEQAASLVLTGDDRLVDRAKEEFAVGGAVPGTWQF